MATVKINNKTYEVPRLGYEHMEMLESEGINVVDVLSKRMVFSITTASIIVIVGCDKQEATRLAEQHVLGGGDIYPIVNAFDEAIDSSDFFKKMLGLDEEVAEPIKAVPKKTVKKAE